MQEHFVRSTWYLDLVKVRNENRRNRKYGTILEVLGTRSIVASRRRAPPCSRLFRELTGPSFTRYYVRATLSTGTLASMIAVPSLPTPSVHKTVDVCTRCISDRGIIFLKQPDATQIFASVVWLCKAFLCSLFALRCHHEDLGVARLLASRLCFLRLGIRKGSRSSAEALGFDFVHGCDGASDHRLISARARAG